MWNLIKKQYYRYTLMTGVYMLEPFESAILHLAYLLGAYFLYKYTLSFLGQLRDGLPVPKF